MAIPKGIPVVTLDKQAFDAVARSLNKTLGIPPALGEGHGHVHGSRVRRCRAGCRRAGSELEKNRGPPILRNHREPRPVRPSRRKSDEAEIDRARIKREQEYQKRKGDGT